MNAASTRIIDGDGCTLHDVDYVVSTGGKPRYDSATIGYHNTFGNGRGQVKLMLGTFDRAMRDISNNKWDPAASDYDFSYLVEYMIQTIVLERVCLERAFERIRMHDRCKPLKVDRDYSCKMDYISELMVGCIKDDIPAIAVRP